MSIRELEVWAQVTPACATAVRTYSADGRLLHRGLFPWFSLSTCSQMSHILSATSGFLTGGAVLSVVTGEHWAGMSLRWHVPRGQGYTAARAILLGMGFALFALHPYGRLFSTSGFQEDPGLSLCSYVGGGGRKFGFWASREVGKTVENELWVRHDGRNVRSKTRGSREGGRGNGQKQKWHVNMVTATGN